MVRTSYSTASSKLQKEIDKLQKKRDSLLAKRRGPVLASIVGQMKELGLTPDDVAAAFAKGGARKGKKTAGTTGAARPKMEIKPKYRNPATGETWTGRGRAPRWVVTAEEQGQNRESLLITE